jgi:hypothetical protein
MGSDMLKSVFFSYFNILVWIVAAAAVSAEEVNSAFSSCSAVPLVIELEKQVKEVLQKRGFSDAVLKRFCFSGSLTLKVPEPEPVHMEGLSQKYSCTADSHIIVQDVNSQECLIEVDQSFSDVGRSEAAARKFVIGKVLKDLLLKISEQMEDAACILYMEGDMNSNEAILDKHIEQLFLFADGIVDDADKKLNSNGKKENTLK